MTENSRHRQVADEAEAVRAEHAEEGSDAAEAERSTLLDVPLYLRTDKEPDAELRQRAAYAQIPVSALVRRLLRDAIAQPQTPTVIDEQVEQVEQTDIETSSLRVIRPVQFSSHG